MNNRAVLFLGVILAIVSAAPRWVPQSETVSFCSKRNGNTSIFTMGDTWSMTVSVVD